MISKIDIAETELKQELFIEYSKIWLDWVLDMSWLKSTWKWLWWVTAYWVWYIKNDPYLMAQVDLQKDLIAVWSELNPLKKFKKLQKLGERIRDLKKVSKIIDFWKVASKIWNWYALWKHLDQFKKYWINNSEKIRIDIKSKFTNL